MRLRANVRPPGRYREDDIEDLPPNPTFVVPTVPFNPNLRPAIFPTLRFDQVAFDHPSVLQRERENLSEERESLREEREQVRDASERVERPARVFRDTRIVPIMEQEDGLMQLPDGSWISMLEPGEYDGFAENWNTEVEDESRERWFLPALGQQKYWSDLSNGMRLIIMREFTSHMSFEDTVLFLEIGETEIEEFLNLCAAETKIRKLAQARDARIQDRQMALIESGDWSVEGNEYGKIFDEEMAKGEDGMPATWLISREDFKFAKDFMGNFRFREEFGGVRGFDISKINKIPSFAVMSSIVNRLDLYIGVASTFEEMNFGDEFIEYLPRDVLIIEEYDELESGSTIRTAVNVPLVPAPAAEFDSQQVHPPLVTMPKTSRLPPIGNFSITKSIPKKDIERSGIDVGLLKKSNGIGRPRKSDHIVKEPSRLREVTNAADLETPRQLASSQIGYDQNSPPARPFNPSPRSAQTLARSPFKEFSLSMPPPKHSASFRDDLPAQPAPTSPPKGSSRSDATDKTAKSAASQHATNCRPVDVVKSATSASSSPSIVSLPKVESDHNARSQETLKATPGVQIPPGVQPARNVQAAPSCQHAPGVQPSPRVNRHKSIQHNSTLAIPKPTISSGPRATSSAQGGVAKLGMSHMTHLQPPKDSRTGSAVSASAAKPFVKSSAQEGVKPNATPKHSLPPENTAASTSGPKCRPTSAQPRTDQNVHAQANPSKNATSVPKLTSTPSDMSQALKTASASTSSILAQLAKSQSDQISPTNTTASPSNSGTDPITASAIRTPAAAAPPRGQPPPSETSSDTKKSTRGTPSPPQSYTHINPTKLKVKIKEAQGSPPYNTASSSRHSSSAGLQGKGIRDEEASKILEEEKLAKKPRNEQPVQDHQTFLNSIHGNLKSLGSKLTNPFKGNSDVGAKLDDRNDRSDGVNNWDRTRESRLKTLNPITLSNHSDAINDLNGANNPRLQTLDPVAVLNQLDPAATSTSSATADNPREPKTPTTSFDFITYSPNKSRSSSPTKLTQGSTRKPGQVSPIKPRQPSVSKVEITSNSSGMVNDSAIQAPTKSFESHLSASGIVNSLEPQTPSKSLDANPKTPNKPRKTSISKAEAMKAAHQAKAVDKSKKFSAPPSIIEKKTKSAARHARTDSQSSVESVDLLRACNSNEVSDSGMPHLQPPDPSKSTVEVQIPARKRAASELLAGSFERLGSPAKKLKSSEASPSCAAALGASKTKVGAGKKGPNKVMKQAEPQMSEDDEYPSASTSAPVSMSDPPAKGPKKKPASGNKSQPKAAPPRPAPPSKPASKAAIKATKATATKAKPKGNKDCK